MRSSVEEALADWFGRNRASLARFASIVLALGGAVWLVYQFWRLVLGEEAIWPGSPTGAIDLRMRRGEVLRWFSGAPLYETVRTAVYPPASLCLLWPFVGWLSLSAARAVWAVVLAGTLGWLAMIVRRESRAPDGWPLTFVTLLPLSLYPAGASVGNGQLTIPVLALVLASLLGIRNRDGSWRSDLVSAGLFVASLAKPDVSAPFFLLLIFTARSLRPAVLVIFGYAALTAVAVWFRGLDDVALYQSTLLRRLFWGAGRQFGGFSEAYQTGRVWIVGLGVFGLLIAGGWTYVHRRSDPWNLLGVVALVSRLGFYHRWYNDLLLLLPMIAVLRLAFGDGISNRAKFVATALFVILVLELLPPGGLFLFPPPWAGLFATVQQGTWLLTLAFLVRVSWALRKRALVQAEAHLGRSQPGFVSSFGAAIARRDAPGAPRPRAGFPRSCRT